MQKHIFNKRMLFDRNKKCLRFITYRIYQKKSFFLNTSAYFDLRQYLSLWYILKNILAYFRYIGLH